ncbi:MAG: YdeI/OmpD-associated family protein [Steroidobacteraceae bacterium]
MARTTDRIRFKARLLRPARPRGAAWSFLVLPADASAKLPARGKVSVQGTLGGQPFRATLEPDGRRSHWLKVPETLRTAAAIEAGATATLEIAVAEKEPEPKMPADLRRALSDNPAAKATWSSITPLARRDWIHWITSGKKAQTRTKRIAAACDMLASGKRRACCFDRSGLYSRGNMGAPEAA